MNPIRCINESITAGVSSCGMTRGEKLEQEYRVTHLLANLGWVDFDLGCSKAGGPLL